MILKILGCGTSTGVPLPGCRCAVCTSNDPRNQRLRSSALIKVKAGCNILIDATTDLRQQALKWDIRRINAIIFTHSHADHILGIDDLRSFNFIQKGPIPCYATQETFEDIKRVFSYIFSPDPAYQGGAVTKLSIHKINLLKPFTISGLRIVPFPLLHGRKEVTGYRLGELAYATDCKGIPAESRDVLRAVKILVLDGLRYKPHQTHFTIPEAVALAKELGVKRTYLTHMTHTVDYSKVNSKLPPGIQLAYDGLEIEFEA